MSANAEKSLLKPNEACEVLRCTRATLRSYVKLGSLRPVKINCRRWLYRATEVANFIGDIP